MSHLRLEAEDWQEPLACLFREYAGRQVRLTLRTGGGQRQLEGTIPTVRHWRCPEEPCLLVRPGSTDAVHVLADMLLTLRQHNGIFFLARRKWYEELDLDATRLGPAPLDLSLEPLD